MSGRIIFKCIDTIGRNYYKLMEVDNINHKYKFIKQLSKKEYNYYVNETKIEVRDV